MLSAKVLGADETAERVLATERGISRGLFDAMRSASLIVERNVKLELTGRSLKVGKGGLRASFTSSVFVVGDNVQGVIGSPVPYARIHETGGTIRPKKGRFLTVPLTDEAKTSSARDFQDAFVFNAGIDDERHLFLARSTGPGAIELLYKLVKSVRIKKTRYMTKAQRASEPKVSALVGGMVTKVVENPGK